MSDTSLQAARLQAARARIPRLARADEGMLVADLIETAGLDAAARDRIAAAGATLVRRIRSDRRPGVMEVFLAEYGLSTGEGIALMCLAEALLRVPDARTMDALIEDKIAPSDWGRHLGHSASSLVNASTWALMLTGRVLDDRSPGMAGQLRGALKRLGEPVIRTAAGRAMREMGRQFVLGEDIGAAMEQACAMEARGYSHSYDMLGEAARTMADARRYHRAYAEAIEAIGRAAGGDIRANPGISVKLSALHPRYEAAQKTRVMAELLPRLVDLARRAARLNIGLNIDAEEADRLDLSLDVIAAALADPGLAGWDGFGVVVQAYGKRAGAVIDWLQALAETHDRRIMVRLVKGAYWDTEIKRAQVLGLPDFPVFTRKPATDVAYIAHARKLLAMTGRLYPQFATHNAHTVAAILDMGPDPATFEFQRLHGMGAALHDIVMADNATRCRIYAPVGAHRDLLAYLVRRLLENGANSSFVHQIVDAEVPPETVAADPFAALEGAALPNPALRRGPDLFAGRRNSQGWDLTDPADLARIEAARAPLRRAAFTAAPMIAGQVMGCPARTALNPADPADTVGRVTDAAPEDVETALAAARPWDAPAATRAAVLRRAADLYEADFGPLFALLAREAGKTLPDCVGEVREAVDFLRYYAAGAGALTAPPCGVFACISPWNFPLAIFTGQVAAALAVGNAVLAKPAEQTCLIAAHAVALLHRAGVPQTALQLLPGDGAVGAALTSDARVDGVAFTGGTETALLIRRAMAQHLSPGAPLIAETGGLNAMIVDSTALPEQAVRDVLASAFQSAGQRCSALRCLYVQQDVFDPFIEMLTGAMAELRPGDPWDLATDIGPVIDADAAAAISAHIETARAEGRVLFQGTPGPGLSVPPALIRVAGIGALEREVFGPVLHVAPFHTGAIETVIDAINATGHGLTFGLHSRIDSRVQDITQRVRAGNLYVNRNQIGAVVGSQPFGGEGLSGTGPKAGGPHYLARFTRPPAPAPGENSAGAAPAPAAETGLQAALNRMTGPAAPAFLRDLPGPTGESNRLALWQRPPILCLGPGDMAAEQAAAVRALGGQAVAHPAPLPEGALTRLGGFSAVLWWGDAAPARRLVRELAARPGPILPLITNQPDAGHVWLERHACIDTTAAGGNARLLAEAGGHG